MKLAYSYINAFNICETEEESNDLVDIYAKHVQGKTKFSITIENKKEDVIFILFNDESILLVFNSFEPKALDLDEPEDYISYISFASIMEELPEDLRAAYENKRKQLGLTSPFIPEIKEL